jgi:hypothetical protein
VLEHNRDLFVFTAEGDGEGMEVWDAHLQRRETQYLQISLIVEDVRGMPNPTNSKTAPAVEGACPLCKIRGTTLPSTKGENAKKGTTYYPGAVCECGEPELKKVRI